MKRRNRRDQQSRDYVCPCNKAYLSYAALYTHIKKYHNEEDNMLQRAQLPQKQKLKRGRPTDNKIEECSQELKILTLYETTALKIYELLSNSSSEVILEGNQQNDITAFQKQYKQLIESSTRSYGEFLTPMDLRHCEENISDIAEGLGKHFKTSVSAILKTMLVIGSIEFQINGSQRQQIIVQMAKCGFNEHGITIAELTFDVLMRGLQRRAVPCDYLGSAEE